MLNKTPKETYEVNDETADLKYEIYRAVKTFCVIMIIFSISILCKARYDNIIKNSRFIKFYPASTVFYQDFSDGKDFKKLEISFKHTALSYGIFKDEKENDKFLLVAKTDEANIPISVTGKYFYFVKDKFLFLSDSENELLNLQKRLKTKNNGFLNVKNVKSTVSKLDSNRDYTLIIDDFSYSNIDAISGVGDTLNKIFDKIILQGSKTEKGLKFSGGIVFDNNLASMVMNIKNIKECFSAKDIKILKFDKNKTILVLAVKDFDLWAKALVILGKNLPDNQYSETLKFIQMFFKTDVESDIIKKLNGNGAFYLVEDKKDFHPLLTIDTKQDIAKQVQKYLGFLQLTNSLTLTEKEVNKKELSILKTNYYPYNLGFATINDNLFLLGHQNIIEHLMNKKINFENKFADFYLYSNITKLPGIDKDKSILCDYKTFEFELSFSKNIVFDGYLSK